MAKAIAYAIDYLHCLKPPLIHRDLSSHSILVDRDLNVKVIDFGIAKIKEYNAVKARSSCVAWTAPEIFKGAPYSIVTDVYSFGIVLWELATKKAPHEGLDPVAISQGVIDNFRPPFPQNCPIDLVDLSRHCWDEDPQRRPTFEKITIRLEKLAFEEDDDFTISSQTSSTRSREDERDLLLGDEETDNLVAIQSSSSSSNQNSPH